MCKKVLFNFFCHQIVIHQVNLDQQSIATVTAPTGKLDLKQSTDWITKSLQ